MSENIEPAAGPQLFGREEALANATYINGEATETGYTARKDPEQATPDYAGDDPVREAAADLAARRGEPEAPLTVKDALGDLDQTEAVTVEQAARDHGTAQTAITTFYDGLDLAKFVEKVDADRAEVIKDDPKVAKELGVEAPKDPAVSKAEQAEAAEIDGMEGLDSETRKALKIPQVRQALEQEFAKVDQASQAYSQALTTANQFALANLVDHIPELASIPAEQWEPALNILAQQDPQRFNRIMGVLQRVGQLQTAQQQWQQQQAHTRHQEFEATRQEYSRASDAALGPMTLSEKAEMAEELVSYVGEYGVSRDQFLREASTNLALHHPAFQRMAADAIKFRRMQKSPAKALPPKVLPVTRPGTSNAVRASAPSAKVAALQAQLETAKGDRAVRIAAQLRSLERKSA